MSFVTACASKPLRSCFGGPIEIWLNSLWHHFLVCGSELHVQNLFVVCKNFVLKTILEIRWTATRTYLATPAIFLWVGCGVLVSFLYFLVRPSVLPSRSDPSVVWAGLDCAGAGNIFFGNFRFRFSSIFINKHISFSERLNASRYQVYVYQKACIHICLCFFKPNLCVYLSISFLSVASG